MHMITSAKNKLIWAKKWGNADAAEDDDYNSCVMWIPKPQELAESF